MIDRFPYGRAPFWLTVLALLSTVGVVLTRSRAEAARPDLVFASFVPNHLAAYKQVAPRFERKHGLRVSFQLVHQRALETRLQNALLAGVEVPDMVEILEGGMSFFTRGPLEDVGFVDLTERLEREGYRSRLVESRLSLWSSRGRVFAIPHDVHPVMLLYRADLVEALGIDVNELDTWERFAEAGRKVIADLDGDGINDRYMIDLPSSGGFGLYVLLLQRGVGLFDAEGRVAFDDELTVDTIVWYLRQTHGKDKIAYECGWGQSLSKAMTDGLALFYIAPDWRARSTLLDIPNLAGKMKLMPLPAWEKGGRRTSVWGGTGLAIARQSRHPELAWELAKLLYFDGPELGRRFTATGLLPPFRDAWNLPEFQAENAYYSGQRLGALYAALAPQTPPVWATAYSRTADGKLSQAFLRSLEYYREHGEAGLAEHVRRELKIAADYVRALVDRNVLAKR